ncbi:MAG: major capsid protein [Defluviitaleaceae bacterium]|nr:major capsid protein [Defluviitaleaceae bacterium]
MAGIFDYVTANEMGSYYNVISGGKAPYLGEELFPADKRLGLDLSWFKGAKGLPVVLKAAGFDTGTPLRERIGVEKIETEMPMFKEATLIKERDRQDLNKILGSGNQSYIDLALKRIFDDNLALIDGAKAQLERMRMQLLSRGGIEIASNGIALEYDYQMDAMHTGEADTAWSDLDNANPVEDLQNWMDVIENDTGLRPARGICSRKTWNYLLRNKAIKTELNALAGAGIYILDDVMAQYLMSRLGLKLTVYGKKFIDESNAPKAFYPDDTVTLMPEESLGTTWFGTTPEESDLLGSAAANVCVVETGIAVTTVKKTDPVNVETKVTMIALPSFERIDEVFIARC